MEDVFPDLDCVVHWVKNNVGTNVFQEATVVVVSDLELINSTFKFKFHIMYR